VTTVAYLLPIVTGALTLRRPARIVWHRRAAYLVLALTVVTAVTGTWMLVAAPKLAGVEEELQRATGTSTVDPAAMRTASTCPTKGSAPARSTCTWLWEPGCVIVPGASFV